MCGWFEFDGNEEDPQVISFDSTRAPIWGDFYAKDGVTDGVENAAWNIGYGDEISGSGFFSVAEDLAVTGHILVPDTVPWITPPPPSPDADVAVPEPITAVMVALGVGALATRLRKRQRATA